MSKAPAKQYDPVDASPVKSFFVSMLTRDIKLEEAILDLLDNCVDGILRTSGKMKGSKPYDGYWANIKFDKDNFEISDNCGGIPWDLHDYAFKMGRDPNRPDDTPGSVGVYGIGMKRAIFKMGEECLLMTQNEKDAYEVEIDKKWIRDEENWSIPVNAAKRTSKEDGTHIMIGSLYPGIAARFSQDAKSFTNELERMVATHYAFIIDKGLSVKINGKTVEPKPTQLVFDPRSSGKTVPAVKPYIFRGEIEGVKVFLAVGFTRPIPSQEEVLAEQDETRWSSMDAGWTIICNDRAVVYCDRSELTGWGEAGVPRYHTQFIAITGVVEFSSDDPAKLPTTTTKRGIDASSTLYLQVKNKMREGLRFFTDYTNRWKGRFEESKAHIAGAKVLGLEQLKVEAKKLPFSETKKVFPKGKAEQYRPSLPMPKQDNKKTRISFLRENEEVRRVSGHLFKGDQDREPSEVGSKCFEIVLEEAAR